MLHSGRATFGAMQAVVFGGRWPKSSPRGPRWTFSAREIASGSSAAIYNHELCQLLRVGASAANLQRGCHFKLQ